MSVGVQVDPMTAPPPQPVKLPGSTWFAANSGPQGPPGEIGGPQVFAPGGVPGGEGGVPGSAGTPAPQSPGRRTFGQCVAQNTAPLRSATGEWVGATLGGGGAAASVMGRLAQFSGAQQVMGGTVDLDLFFGVPGAASSLFEGGTAAIAAGNATIAAGGTAAFWGGALAVAVSGAAAAYAVTSVGICAIDAQY